ncbi:MAG: phage tail tape measure protein [Mycobacteriaceae bacterium]
MSLEASEVAVRVRLLGGSAFEKEAAGVAKSTEAIGAAGKKASEELAASGVRSSNVLTGTGKKLDSLGSKMSKLGRAMVTVGVPIAAVGYIAAKMSTSFNQAMMLLVTQAGMAQKSLGSMSNAVMAMAPKVGATPLALAQALYPIESIGLRGKDALNTLKAAAIGSAVGLDSLENTADAVTTVMASHIRGAGGPVEAMSLMDKAIGVGKMHLADLTDSFKSAIIPMSQTFGLSFKQILSAAAALTRLGIPASQVMARMRLSLTSMVSPTTMGAKALKILHFNQLQLAADLRSPGGLITALEDLNMHTAGMDPTQADNLIAQIFGKSRGMGNIAALLKALPQMEGIYGQVMGTTPETLMQHFAQTKTTSAFKYKAARADIDKALIKLGDAVNKYVLPVLAKLVPYLTKVVNWFGHLPGGVQKAIIFFGLLVVAGGPVLIFFGSLVSAGGVLLGAIGSLAGMSGFGALAAGVTMTISSLALLVPAIAAVVALVATHKKIEHAGYTAGRQAAHGVANLFGAITGNHKPGQYLNTQDYLNSTAFKRLNAVQRSDIEGLLAGPNSWASRHKAAVRMDLAGVKLPTNVGLPKLAAGGTVMNAGTAIVGEVGPELVTLPRGATVAPLSGGIGSGFVRALGEAMSNMNIQTQVVLDSKVIAESTSRANRKLLNRQ